MGIGQNCNNYIHAVWGRNQPAALSFARLQELSADTAVAEGDLTRKLGTLRYLAGLKAQRTRALGAAPPGADAPAPFLSGRGAFHLNFVKLFWVTL